MLHSQGLPFSVTQILAQSGVAVTAPADTNEDILATITVPAGAMGPNGSVRLFMQMAVTNNGNNKTFRVRLGGISGTFFMSVSPINSTQAAAQTMIWNNNSAAVQAGGSQLFSNAGTAFSDEGYTGAINTAVAQTIVITVQKAVGGDTATLTSFTCELLPGA